MNFTNFLILIIGVSFILLIGNVHGEESKTMPVKVTEDPQIAPNLDHSAKYQDDTQDSHTREFQNPKSSNTNSDIVEPTENIEEVQNSKTCKDKNEPIDCSDAPKYIIGPMPHLEKRKQNESTKSRRKPRIFDEIAEPESQEDTTNYRDPKIIGGIPDRKHEIKYQVVLHNGDKNVCGATILSDRYLLSAANCFIDDKNNPYGEQTYVLIGTNKLSDHPAHIPKVETVYVPAEFNGSQVPEERGDIAVLKLDKGLGLDKDSNITRIRLPEPLHDGSYDLYVGKEALVAGYGADYPNFGSEFTSDLELEIKGFHYPKKLVFAKVDILEQSNCEMEWFPLEVYSSQMCGRLQGFGYRGICVGDSGNALVYNNTAIGVVSHAYRTCNEGYIHTGKPTIYTRVSSYIEFINDAMADKTSNKTRTFDISYTSDN